MSSGTDTQSSMWFGSAFGKVGVHPPNPPVCGFTTCGRVGTGRSHRGPTPLEPGSGQRPPDPTPGGLCRSRFAGIRLPGRRSLR